MKFRALEVDVDRHQVVLFADGIVAGSARWDGTTLGERVGPLDAESWDELAAMLRDDEAEALAAAAAGSHDEAGVDLTLIDWMLGLTPSERLEFLRRQAAGLAPFVKDDAAQ